MCIRDRLYTSSSLSNKFQSTFGVWVGPQGGYNYFGTFSKFLESKGTGYVPVSYTHLDVYKRQVPILRIILISQGYYNQFHLYFLDINYHFGLIFNNFLTMLGDLSLSQNVNQLFTIFTNIYTCLLYTSRCV